jgi:hypothetical protein
MSPDPKSPNDPQPPRQPPELYQIVVECTDEEEQRKWFDRLRSEGLKLRLLVL